MFIYLLSQIFFFSFIYSFLRYFFVLSFRTDPLFDREEGGARDSEPVDVAVSEPQPPDTAAGHHQSLPLRHATAGGGGDRRQRGHAAESHPRPAREPAVQAGATGRSRARHRACVRQPQQQPSTDRQV